MGEGTVSRGMAQRTEVHRDRLGNQKQRNGRRKQTPQIDIKIREVHPRRAFGAFVPGRSTSQEPWAVAARAVGPRRTPQALRPTITQPSTGRYFVGFHSRASHCVSAIWSGVILAASLRCVLAVYGPTRGRSAVSTPSCMASITSTRPTRSSTGTTRSATSGGVA